MINENDRVHNISGGLEFVIDNENRKRESKNDRKKNPK